MYKVRCDISVNCYLCDKEIGWTDSEETGMNITICVSCELKTKEGIIYLKQ